MRSLLILTIFTLLICQVYSEAQCCAEETWTDCPSSCHGNCCPKNQIKMCSSNTNTRCLLKDEVQNAIQTIEQQISEGSCLFYDEVEKLYQCGSDGYPVSFGQKFCQEFLDDYNSYENKEWQNAVRKCLQERISGEIQKNYNDKQSFVCQNLSDFAFNSHIDCYVKPIPEKEEVSYCNNPFMDNLKIGWSVLTGGAIGKAISQAGPVSCRCVINYNKYNKMGLVQNAPICLIYASSWALSAVEKIKKMYPGQE